MKWSLIIIAVFCTPRETLGANCNATSDLSELTLNKFLNTFKALVVKFDVAYPYGEKHDEFCRFAIEASEVNEVFMGEVGMKDYGERDNMDFAKRFGVHGHNPSIVLMFTSPDGRVQHEEFEDDWTVEKMRAFTYEHSRVYIPRPGCIHVFDVLAIKFMSLKDSDTREVVLKEARNEPLSSNSSGQYYIKIMEKLMTQDGSFIQSEASRLNKILHSYDKTNEAKKLQFIHRLNILRSFNTESNTREEL